jgi:hypothetical protein
LAAAAVATWQQCGVSGGSSRKGRAVGRAVAVGGSSLVVAARHWRRRQRGGGGSSVAAAWQQHGSSAATARQEKVKMMEESGDVEPQNLSVKLTLISESW